MGTCVNAASPLPDCYGSGGKCRQQISLANALRESPEKVADTVGVVADESSITGQHRVAATNLHQNPTHPQHPPGAVEDLLGGSLVVDHARIELAQHVAHLFHPRDQLFVGDEISVEALHCSTGERDR